MFAGGNYQDTTNIVITGSLQLGSTVKVNFYIFSLYGLYDYSSYAPTISLTVTNLRRGVNPVEFLISMESSRFQSL